MKFILLQNMSFAPVINVRPKVSLKSRKAAWRHASAMAPAVAVACKARDKIPSDNFPYPRSTITLVIKLN